MSTEHPISILYKPIAGRYRPVRVADRPITTHYKFIKNAIWADPNSKRGYLRENLLTWTDSFSSLFWWCRVRWLPSIYVVIFNMVIKQVLLAETFTTVLEWTLVLIVVWFNHKSLSRNRHSIGSWNVSGKKYVKYIQVLSWCFTAQSPLLRSLQADQLTYSYFSWTA